MVDPEPCKEIQWRPQLFMAGGVPYQPSSARVWIVALMGSGQTWLKQNCAALSSKGAPRNPGVKSETGLLAWDQKGPEGCASRGKMDQILVKS